MSSILKGYSIQDIPVKPYEMREVIGGDPLETPDPRFFKGLNEKENSADDPVPTLSPENRETKEANRERIAEIEREAYEEAFKLGEKTGAERGERIFRSAVQSFVEAAEGLKRMQQEFYGRVEEEILDLVLAATRKVVRREADSQKEMILDVLRDAIAKTIDREKIHVRINPSDFDFVHAHKPDIMRTVDGIKHLVIEKDDAISRGGAIVETDYGSIDARIERRLEEVEKALKRQIAEKDRAVNREETEETVKETDGTKATMTNAKAQSSNDI